MIPTRLLRAAGRRRRRLRARAWALVDGVHLGARSQVSPGCVLDLEPGAVVRFGRNCFLDRGVVIRVNVGGELTVGDDVFLGAGVLLNAAGRVRIGSGSNLAEGASVHDADHVPGRPPNTGGLLVDPIEIGRDVWVAAKATVLRGVRIGDGAVVGAGSVVRADVPSRSLVAGVPAREIRRFDDDRPGAGVDRGTGAG